MGRPVTFTFSASSTTAICSAQTTGAAAALTIDGAALDVAYTTNNGLRRALAGGGFGRPVTLTSAANASGVNFTVTGFDVNNVAVSETLAGPNTTTVSTTALFAVVTGVSTSATLSASTSAGFATTGTSRWFKTNMEIAPTNHALYVAVTGTINVTVQDTPDNVDTVAAPVTYNHPTLASITSNANSNYAYPPRAIRFVVNSSTSPGTAALTIIPAGIRGN